MNSPDYTSKPASEHTRAFNGAAATPLDPEDFTRAQRGFIASLEDTKITDAVEHVEIPEDRAKGCIHHAEAVAGEIRALTQHSFNVLKLQA